jgi:ketosteroid isomerase-like protein
MSSADVELARRGFEAIKRGDLAEIGALLEEDVKWHWGDPSAEGACRNRNQALAFMQRPGRRGPGELIDVLDAGDRAVVITQPPPVDGEVPPLHAQITTFRDGKVIEMVGYPTVDAALAAAGVQWER